LWVVQQAVCACLIEDFLPATSPPSDISSIQATSECYEYISLVSVQNKYWRYQMAEYKISPDNDVLCNLGMSTSSIA